MSSRLARVGELEDPALAPLPAMVMVIGRVCTGPVASTGIVPVARSADPQA
jgi:hypothetical protein